MTKPAIVEALGGHHSEEAKTGAETYVKQTL